MLTIGMLLGIPEPDQIAIRDRIDATLRIDDDTDVPAADLGLAGTELIADYIDWRAEHPSDDLMTQLITAEFEDETGTIRKLERREVLTYVMLLAGAGNETTTRLDRLVGEAPGRASRPTATSSPPIARSCPRRSRRSCATRHRRRCRRAP